MCKESVTCCKAVSQLCSVEDKACASKDGSGRRESVHLKYDAPNIRPAPVAAAARHTLLVETEHGECAREHEVSGGRAERAGVC